MKSTNKYKYKYIELQSQSVGIRGIFNTDKEHMQIITDSFNFFNYMLAVLRLGQSPKVPRVGELVIMIRILFAPALRDQKKRKAWHQISMTFDKTLRARSLGDFGRCGDHYGRNISCGARNTMIVSFNICYMERFVLSILQYPSGSYYE